MAREFLTLADLRDRKGMRGIVKQLNKSNALLRSLVYEVAPKGYLEYPVVTELPTASFRGFNESGNRSVSRTVNLREEMALIDNAFWVEQGGGMSGPEAIAGELPQQIEAVAQEFNTAFWYGARNEDPRSLNGLDIRLPLLSSGGQVLSAAGTGTDLMSIWFLRIGEDGVHGFIESPEDFLSGQMVGDRPCYDPNGVVKNVLGWAGHARMRAGIAVKNPNAVCQICNIETAGTSNILTLELMTKAQALCKGATHIFANATGWAQIQKVYQGSSSITKDEFGHPVLNVGPVPIYVDDALTITEPAKAA